MPRLASALRTFALLATFSTAACFAQQVMDNAAVLKLQKAGLSDDLLVSTINGSPGKYSTTTDDLISLKKAGLSDKVIGAMVMRNNAPAAAAAAPVPAGMTSAPVDEVGVYYKDPKTTQWVVVMPEIVNFKTGGALKSFASGGLVKGDLNGHVAGKESKLTLTTPVSILLYVPEGTAPTEYQLLKLRDSGDGREFRSVTGGIVHVSSGAGRDQVEFKYDKIAPRSYVISMPAGSPAGQYGILPPGANASSNSASGGKMYTFHLAE